MWNNRWILGAACYSLFVVSACFYTPQGSDLTVNSTTPDEPTTLAAHSTTDASTTSTTTDASTTTKAENPTTTEDVSTDESTVPAPDCGDGVMNEGEACDDGNEINGDACTNACTLAVCGDGILGPGEACDDGNSFDNDACTSACVDAACGDAIIGPGEQCDDANNFNGDACTNACTLAICGDGVLGPGEQCDDANEFDDDICRNDCTLPMCGDGLVQPGEACDDGDNEPGDTCSPGCTSTDIAELITGGDTTCLRFITGAIRCWGTGTSGKSGQGDTGHRGDNPGELPVTDVPVGFAAAGVTSGYDHVCAWTDAGAVRCWGDNDFGQLGLGDNTGDHENIGDQPGELPPANIDLGGPVLQVVAGVDHTCALMDDHKVRCWGRNNYGQLGIGNTTTIGDGPGEMPPAPVNALTNVEQLAAGADFTCARNTIGQMSCWGNNDYGQLGRGDISHVGDDMDDMINYSIPIGGVVAHVTTGYYFTCALLTNGNVRCWGINEDGQLGRGDTEVIGDEPGEMPPVNINIGGTAVELVTGANHSCIRLGNGVVRCWGRGSFGRLGYAAITDLGVGPNDMPPPDVSLGGVATSLSAQMTAHTCARVETPNEDPSLRCWGKNSYGQLGLGHTAHIGDDELPSVPLPIPY